LCRYVVAPVAATKVYIIAPDIAFDAQVLGALADAGLPVRAVINVARARLPPPTPAAEHGPEGGGIPEGGPEGEGGEGGGDAAEAEAPGEDDAFPSFTAGLMAAHDAAVTARDFTAGCRAVAVVPVAFARAGEVPDAEALAVQLCGAAAALAASDLAYESWKSAATIVPVANAARDAAKVDTRAYHQLLAGVPHERATCATVLDALIGQVCASTCDPKDVAKAADIAAMEAAKAAIAAALGGVRLAAIPEASSTLITAAVDDTTATEEEEGAEEVEASPQLSAVTLLQEGDMMSTLKSTFGPGALSAVLNGATAAPIASVVKLDPDDVEAKMVGLIPGPGTDRAAMPTQPGMNDDACGVRKTAMTAFLPSAETPLQVMERHELLGVAAGLLPPGLAEDHAAELKGRRHWEPITREAYATVYAAARLDLSVSAQCYHAPEDALLTVLHPPPEHEDVRHVLPRALTFAEYHHVYAGALVGKKAVDAAAAAAEAAKAKAKAAAAEEAAAAAAAEGGAPEGGFKVPGLAVLATVGSVAAGADAEEGAAAAAGVGKGGEEEVTEDAEVAAPPAPPPPLVPMPAVAYTVETATQALTAHMHRIYPHGGAIVTLARDGRGAATSTVVAGGVTIGLRAGGGVTATLADEVGLSAVEESVFFTSTQKAEDDNQMTPFFPTKTSPAKPSQP
jgi:CRISPR-associated protein Cas5t